MYDGITSSVQEFKTLENLENENEKLKSLLRFYVLYRNLIKILQQIYSTKLL
ncbi:hypothetical protein FTV88_0125 [Heliorestis convoluta]|uniref:Uncharacterized protein n=1 Tax=Heliorestis convoluta TaxID=356322 RepID=A0A5Q2MVP5_9FIRM|nr:hypothetical protein FTV88_0125 [Heliorestis convoluta]